MEISSLESEELMCSASEQPSPASPSAAKGLKLQKIASGAIVVLDPEAGAETESRGRKLPSSRYKGVVSQPNGRWGSQIYEKHRRVWLGTFSAEAEAAWAYDVAAQRFRGRHAATNFDPLAVTEDGDAAAELSFLNSRSKGEIVDMLRKHTYREELKQSLRFSTHVGNRRTNPSATVGPELLFSKILTPSDVGKLNRLVIPKHHAKKHFQLQRTGGAVLLNFEDAGGKVWRFRYSYWNSSQSYVLTKGWSRFMKEKGLKPGDLVVFQQSIDDAEHKQLLISYKRRAFPALPRPPAKVMRLFGVDIVKISVASDDWIGKRVKRNDDG